MSYSVRSHLSRVERKIDALMHAQNLEIELEIMQMADFSRLITEVEATRGAAESTRKFVEGLEAKLAELSEGMNDEADQAKVEELAEELAKIRDSLPKAVVANPGGSTGGIQE